MAILHAGRWLVKRDAEGVEKVIFFGFSRDFSYVNHHIWLKIKWFFNN